MPTDRTVRVRLTADSKGFIASMKAAGKAVGDLRHDIDSTNDRTAWLAQSFLALGPSLVPIGAAAVPALAGLTTQLGLAVGAAGVAALAFNGVGDALKALNTYQMDPTEKHLEALQVAMREIGPEGARFVRVLDSVGPAFADLANTSRRNLFPGLEDAIRTFVDDLLPRLKVIVGEVAGAMGDLARDASQNLAGPKWEAFFDFLRDEAQPLLEEMGRSVGNFANGFANMVVAFAPLTERFSRGLLRMSRSFADWSAGLDDNSSFQDFLAYIERVGPKVLSLFESLVEALVQLTEAAAPVGEQMLPIFSKFFDIIAALANTPLGPTFIAAAAGLSLMGRAMALADITGGGALGRITKRTRDTAKEAVRARLAWRDLANTMIYAGHTQRDFLALSKIGPIGHEEAAHAMNARENVKQYGKAVAGAAGQVGLLAVAMSDLDDKMGLTNTALFALMGSMAGPWGAAAGAAIGFTMDFAKSNDELAESIENADAAASSSNLTQMLEERAKLETELAEMRKKMNSAKTGLGGNPFDFLNAVFNQDQVDDAQAALDGINASIERTQTHLRGMGTIQGPRGMGQMFSELDSAATKAKLALQDFSEEVLDVQNLLDRSGSLIAYERALDDLSKGLKENGNAWDVGTEAGRKNLELRNALVEKAILRAQTLKEEGDELGAQRILNRAISDLETFVGDSKGAKRKAIQPLIEALKDIDKTEAKPKIKLDNKQALNEISEVNTAWDAMVRHVSQTRAAQMDIRLGGHGFAEGGYTGDGGRNDVAGLVHRGEFVFDAPTTARNRGFFEAIHKGMAGYANGGYVGATAQPAMPVMPGIDYDRLSNAMLMARPLYRDMHINGDPTVWRKQMEDDARAASSGKLGG